MAEQKTIVGQSVAEVADVLDEKATKIVTETGDSISTLADKTGDSLSTLMDRVIEVVQQYAPDAANAALGILRLDAVVASVPLLIAMVFMAALARWMYSTTRHVYKENAMYEIYREMLPSEREAHLKNGGSRGDKKDESLVLFPFFTVLFLLIFVILLLNVVQPVVGVVFPEYWALVKAGVL